MIVCHIVVDHVGVARIIVEERAHEGISRYVLLRRYTCEIHFAENNWIGRSKIIQF